MSNENGRKVHIMANLGFQVNKKSSEFSLLRSTILAIRMLSLDETKLPSKQCEGRQSKMEPSELEVNSVVLEVTRSKSRAALGHHGLMDLD